MQALVLALGLEPLRGPSAQELEDTEIGQLFRDVNDRVDPELRLGILRHFQDEWGLVPDVAMFAVTDDADLTAFKNGLSVPQKQMGVLLQRRQLENL